MQVRYGGNPLTTPTRRTGDTLRAATGYIDTRGVLACALRRRETRKTARNEGNMTTSDITRQLEQIINNDAVLRGLFEVNEPGWRYFHVGKTLDSDPKRGFPMFAWSTERDRTGKFHSWVWQPDKNGWKRTKTVSHAKRKTAKARALRMRDKYRENR